MNIKNFNINEMIVNNIHLGHRKKYFHKSMENYIININKKIHIINLEYTLKNLNKIKLILKNLKNFNKKLLLVCVEKKTRTIVKSAFENINMPYVNKRWLGGSLTNFKTLKNSIDNLNYIKSILKNKNFKIKKKKKLLLNKKILKSNRFLEGLMNLKKIPDYVFIINIKKHKNVIKESKKMGVITIGVVDTNNDIKNIDYIIPGNDDSYKSILFYIKKISNFIKND